MIKLISKQRMGIAIISILTMISVSLNMIDSGIDDRNPIVYYSLGTLSFYLCFFGLSLLFNKTIEVKQ